VDAVKALVKMINSPGQLTPDAYEKGLAKFGGAMQAFDNFDQTSGGSSVGTTTVFAMFDALLRLASGAAPANVGVLRLSSRVNGATVEKLFMTPAAVAAS
jgi:hypothetical protein